MSKTSCFEKECESEKQILVTIIKLLKMIKTLKT